MEEITCKKKKGNRKMEEVVKEKDKKMVQRWECQRGSKTQRITLKCWLVLKGSKICNRQAWKDEW